MNNNILLSELSLIYLEGDDVDSKNHAEKLYEKSKALQEQIQRGVPFGWKTITKKEDEVLYIKNNKTDEIISLISFRETNNGIEVIGYASIKTFGHILFKNFLYLYRNKRIYLTTDGRPGSRDKVQDAYSKYFIEENNKPHINKSTGEITWEASKNPENPFLLIEKDTWFLPLSAKSLKLDEGTPPDKGTPPDEGTPPISYFFDSRESSTSHSSKRPKTNATGKKYKKTKNMKYHTKKNKNKKKTKNMKYYIKKIKKTRRNKKNTR